MVPTVVVGVAVDVQNNGTIYIDIDLLNIRVTPLIIVICMIFNQDVFNITCVACLAIDVHNNGVIYVDVALLHIYAAFFGCSSYCDLQPIGF